MAVRQTTCRHCGQDIENFSPYRRGEWRDRGNNPTCPTPEGDAGQVHAPYREPPTVIITKKTKTVTPPKRTKPPRLTKGQRANFETLRRACTAGHLALVSALRTDGTPVAVLCAMQENEDGTISPVPLAYQFADNPYDELQDPTV